MVFKPLKKRVVSWLGPRIAFWTIKLLGQTMRFEVVNPEIQESFLARGNPFIGVFWHGRLLMMPILYKGKRANILVSPHRDGQIVGKALERFGFGLIPGSTTRNGFPAVKKMIKALQNGSDIGLVPDGPRGPRYQVQKGVIELAKLTGRPMIPLSFSASRKKIFKTWDQFLLPYPFSKGVFILGEPIYVDRDGDHAHLEEKRVLLEKCLNTLTEKADHYFDPKK